MNSLQILSKDTNKQGIEDEMGEVCIAVMFFSLYLSIQQHITCLQ